MEQQSRLQLAVCDADTDYVQRLSDYMNEKHGFPFEALAFNDSASLRAYLERHTVRVVMIAENMLTGELEALKQSQANTKWLLLSARTSEIERMEDGEDHVIFKYQSAEALIDQVLLVMAADLPAQQQESGIAVPVPDRIPMMTMIAVCSPIGRCGKTGLALAMGEILSRKRKVLYLNMEVCSGFSVLDGIRAEGGDLTDLLYFLREDPDSMVYRIGSLIHTIGDLDYIMPAFSTADLEDVTASEWIALFNAVSAAGDYEVVILDLGTQVREIYRLLRCCAHVFVPVLSDPLSRAKANEFIRGASVSGQHDLSERMTALEVPAVPMHLHDRNFADELAAGKLGDYARKLCRSRRLL